MKDMGEASFVLVIEIHRHKFLGLLGLFQKAYVNRVLKRFNTDGCSPHEAPIVKGDKFSSSQVLKNALEARAMKQIPYALQ